VADRTANDQRFLTIFSTARGQGPGDGDAGGDVVESAVQVLAGGPQLVEHLRADQPAVGHQ
jgi:hypothetical protein